MRNMVTDGVMGSHHDKNENKNKQRNIQKSSDKCRMSSEGPPAVLSIKKTAKVTCGLKDCRKWSGSWGRWAEDRPLTMYPNNNKTPPPSCILSEGGMYPNRKKHPLCLAFWVRKGWCQMQNEKENSIPCMPNSLSLPLRFTAISCHVRIFISDGGSL